METAVFMEHGAIVESGAFNKSDLASVMPIDYIVAVIRESFIDPSKPPLIIIEAPTGVGKTTDLVVLLYRYLYKNVFVFVPKVSIANGVSRYITSDKYVKDQGLHLGVNVGKITGAETIQPSTSPSIRFATSTLMDDMLNELLFNGESICIIDEAHAVADSTSMTNAMQDIHMYKNAKANGSDIGNSFCVIMSATPNISYWSYYFGITPDMPNIIRMRETTLFPIVPIKAPAIPAKKVDKTIEEIMTREKFSRGIVFSFAYRFNHNTRIDGYEIVRFSRAEMEKNKNVLADHPGKNIIFESTQVGEAGVTFDDVDVVFDDGITNTKITIPVLMSTMLVMSQAPQSTRMQRRGRVGRTGKGNNVLLQIEEGKELNVLQPEDGVKKINFSNDVAAAISINPTLYDILRVCSTPETVMYQLPLAGVFEPIMTKIMWMGLHFLTQDEIKILNGIGKSCYVGLETVCMMLALFDYGMGYESLTIAAAYHSLVGDSGNKILKAISTYEAENSTVHNCDVSYIIDLLTDVHFYNEFQKHTDKHNIETDKFLDEILVRQHTIKLGTNVHLPFLRNMVSSKKNDSMALYNFISSMTPSCNMATAKGDKKVYNIMNMCEANCALDFSCMVFYGSTMRLDYNGYNFMPYFYIVQ